MKRKCLKALTFIGCYSTGIIYGSIGVIAILSFMKLKQGGADESSFFKLIDGFTLGRVLNWFIIIGAVCFIIWRLIEAFADPHNRGSDGKALLLRTGAAFSSVADAFIAFSALQVMYTRQQITESGEPTQQRDMVADALETEWGRIAIFTVAVLVLLTALVLAFYGLSKRFTETINADDFTKWQTYVMHGLAFLGYLSRAVILGLVGFFYLKAALERNSNLVVNTDKAFDFIGDHVGGFAFILTAVGTICYGLYLFVLGVNYDVGKRKQQ